MLYLIKHDDNPSVLTDEIPNDVPTRNRTYYAAAYTGDALDAKYPAVVHTPTMVADVTGLSLPDAYRLLIQMVLDHVVYSFNREHYATHMP